jgi:hypothetical protein
VRLVDDRGRILGLVNLIDVIIAGAAVGLIAVAYSAYLLFRTPDPRLFTITPTLIYQRQDVLVTITGKNLRPFLRVTFDNAVARSEVLLFNPRDLVTARTYVRGSTTSATFELPELMAGTYDVVLWKARQEISRLSGALTVLPLAPALIIELRVRGAFTRVPSGQTNLLKAGAQFSTAGAPTATILDAGVPAPSMMRVRAGSTTMVLPIDGRVDVPATLRVKCFTVSNPDGTLRCAIAGPVQQADITPGSVLLLNGADGWISFRISDVLAPASSSIRAQPNVSLGGAALLPE